MAVELRDRSWIHARRLHVDGQERDPLVLRRVGIRAHQREDPVGERAERRPDLLAVHDVLVAVEHGARPQRGEVAAGLRFAEALRPDDVRGQDPRQPLPFLLLAAVDHERRPHEVLAENADALGPAGQEVLLLEDGLLDGIGAAAAVLDRPPDRAVARAEQLLLPRPVRLEPLARPGRWQVLRYVRREPRPDLLPEGLLLGRVRKIHQKAGSLMGPPSSTSTLPCTNDAAGDSRYRQAAPRSSGRPSRPTPIFAAASSIFAASFPNRLSSAASVAMSPGSTAFTRTPRSPHSAASVFVRLTTPALAAA